MDKAIEDFANRMQFKLNKNKDKECDVMNPDDKGRSWSHCNLTWLLFRLREETLELEQALRAGDVESALNEAGDVGNFAMMIHDNLNSQKK